MAQDEYEYFIESLKWCISDKWKRQQGLLAEESGISKPYLSEILNGKKKASFETQVAISRVCGYEYDGFLALGRTLLNNEIPHGKSSGINQTATQKKVGSGMDNQNDDAILQHYREELAALREEIRYLREERNRFRDRIDELEKHRVNEPEEKKTAV